MRKSKGILFFLLVCLGVMPLHAQELYIPWKESFSSLRPLFRQDTVTLLFGGDLMMHKRQLEYDHRTFLEPVRSYLERADLAVVNMEFTLAGEPYTGYPAFSTPESYPRYAADCGVDVFLTANNHILDKGKSGLVRTLQRYREMEQERHIRITGTAEDAAADTASNPLVMAVKGIRIALINFTYGTNQKATSVWPKINGMDKEDICAAIRRARRRNVDLIIALPHWGTEYRLRHDPEQEAFALWLAGQGVDAIIGAHPHVVQDAGLIKTPGREVPVFYSLGNLVSNMTAPNTRLELFVTLRVTRDRFGELHMLPPRADYLWCSQPGCLTDTYQALAVRDFIGKRDLWRDPSDYDNMIQTYNRVKAATGIKD